MKKHTILMVGLGSIGGRHLRNLRALGDHSILCYRTGQGSLCEKEFDGVVNEKDLRKALQHHPDIAVISNPTAIHMETALACARSGCHLFIEKPLSSNLEGCDELMRIVRENRLITMIGCQFRFHPLLSSLKKQLDTGKVGRVAGARAEWGEYLPDWHPWEDYRQSYSARRDLGGGVTLTLIHPLDYLYWIFGPVIQTKAMSSKVPSLGTEVEDDYAEITLRHRPGIISQIHLDYLQKPPVHTLTVWGEKGRALWDYHAGSLVWLDPTGAESRETVSRGFERNYLFLEEMRHFLECVNGCRNTMVPLEDGIEVLKIASEALKSG
jgi:predicted dehydrogenase